MAEITRLAGTPGLITAAQVVGGTGGTFKDSTGAQFNILAPGSGRLEQWPFIVKASGWLRLPAGTYTATVIAALYGVAGSAAWTAASGNKIAASTSLSVTQAGTVTALIPFTIEAKCEGDSTSGKLQGIMQDIVNNIKDSTNNGAILTNAPTGVNFQTEPPLQFAVGLELTNAGATATGNLGSFYLAAD